MNMVVCPHGWAAAGPCPGCTGLTNFLNSMAPPVARPCDHCYCIPHSYSLKTSQEHVECCNCGNRQLAVRMSGQRNA